MRAMHPLATVDLTRNSDVPIIRLCGEIDTANVGQVGNALAAIAADARHAGLVLDLSDVTYLNSATVKLLFDLAEQMRKRQQQLRLVMIETAPMRRPLLLLKFDLVVPLHTSIDEAAEHIRRSRNTGG
jgi:anti-anti-sigma factor